MIELFDPCDVMEAADRFESRGQRATMTMLDPWYNKGVGGVREDYFDYITGVLRKIAAFSDHVTAKSPGVRAARAVASAGGSSPKNPRNAAPTCSGAR